MKTSLIVISGLLAAGTAHAGAIDSACMKYAGRANAATCGCIQQVADSTLSRSDQRRAAGFFKDPDKAQEVRMSPSQADNDFWARYKAFAETAEAYCTR